MLHKMTYGECEHHEILCGHFNKHTIHLHNFLIKTHKQHVENKSKSLPMQLRPVREGLYPASHSHLNPPIVFIH